MPWNIEAERDYWRHKCLNSFWWFFKYAWGYDFNPKGAAGGRPWADEASHRPACEWFQEHALKWITDRKAGNGHQTKLIIIVPRDWGKTTLFTQAGQVWLHLHDPELATYTGCETITRASEVLEGIKAVISGEDKYSRFSWLYGNQRHINRAWSKKVAITAARTNMTRRDASFGTWAVESGMVGLHPDGCFFDDPNTYEQIQRKSNWMQMVNSHLDSLIPVFQQDAIWCLTGTRYGDGDHLGKSIRTEGALTVSGMPMKHVDPRPDGQWHVFFMDAENDAYPLSDPRHFVMPKIWNLDRINAFKSRNPVRYYAQVRNNPTESPYNVLSFDFCSKLIKPRSEIDLRKLRVSLHLDTAFRLAEYREKSDYNVVSAVGHMTDGTGRCVYLGARAAPDWDTNELGRALIAAVKEWRQQCARISCITDEQSMNHKPGVWEAWIANLFQSNRIPMPHFHILPRVNNASKEARLREAAAMWLDGRMILMEGAEHLDMLVDQMVKIGMTEHDDIADATANCWSRDVYRSVYMTETGIMKERRNPFDDVLKPGGIGDQAADEIAQRFEDERLFNASFDVVQP